MRRDPFDILDAERERIDRFFTGLTGDDWLEPTGCPGWNRRDLLAHLVGGQEYTEACLDENLADYVAQAEGAGYEELNEVLVSRRAGQEPDELLREWRIKISDNHARLRQRGVDGTMMTSVGPYPVGRQALYLACELAIHADDAGVPVTTGEQAERLAWRAEFGMDALTESRPGARVERSGDTYTVWYEGQSATLPEAAFVAATSGRLAGDPVPAGALAGGPATDGPARGPLPDGPAPGPLPDGPAPGPLPDGLRRALVVLA